MENITNTTQQTPIGDPAPQGPGTGGSAAPKQTPGTTPDPNKIRDPNTDTPSKVEEPAPVEMPDIAKPDTKPNVGKGGDVKPPKEPAE